MQALSDAKVELLRGTRQRQRRTTRQRRTGETQRRRPGGRAPRLRPARRPARVPSARRRPDPARRVRRGHRDARRFAVAVRRVTVRAGAVQPAAALPRVPAGPDRLRHAHRVRVAADRIEDADEQRRTGAHRDDRKGEPGNRNRTRRCRIKQFADFTEAPGQLFHSIDAMQSWINSELRLQVDWAMDAHAVAQIAAATPPTGKTGADLISRVRTP